MLYRKIRIGQNFGRCPIPCEDKPCPCQRLGNDDVSWRGRTGVIARVIVDSAEWVLIDATLDTHDHCQYPYLPRTRANLSGRLSPELVYGLGASTSRCSPLTYLAVRRF